MAKALLTFFVSLNAYAGMFDWVIDDLGAKVRLGSYLSEHEAKSSGIILKEAKRKGKAKFPIIPTYRTRVRGKYFFTKVFFDYEFPNESLNLAPQEGHDRNQIQNSFIDGSTEQTFIASNPNWNITADMKTWSLAIGYQWGVFYPLNNETRLFKIGGGVLGGLLDFRYKFYLCSDYTTNAETIDSSTISSGSCSSKTLIDELDFTGLGLGLAITFTVYEVSKKNWSLSVLEFDFGVMSPLADKKLKGRAGTPKVETSTSYVNVDIVNYSYFFF